MNKWCFVCTYRWAGPREPLENGEMKRDDTALQIQDSKFEPYWSEAEGATSLGH